MDWVVRVISKPWHVSFFLALSCLAIGLEGDAIADASKRSEGERLFDRVVKPTLESRCYSCHAEAADRIKGGLLLDRAAGLLQGGHSGPAIVPGDPDASLLIRAIRHEEFEMPPKGDRLDEETVEQFVRWIALGAPDPRAAPMIVLSGEVDLDAGREHWAFRPLDQKLVDATGEPLPRSIDGLVARRLAEAELDFASEAASRDLLRRVSFDLTGLPPSGEEADRFRGNGRSDAYERLVDRLLASPRFGERQSQIWLDVVRFAESEGFEYDRPLPGAWRYRDYVIGAFNRDKPYDRFILEQLAGDESVSATEEELAAAVFHRLGAVRRNAGNPDIALSRNEVLTERTDVIGAAVLGVTVGCARCHDHKFDPISQRDYYQLQAYLAATAEHDVVLVEPDAVADWKRRMESIEKSLKALGKRVTRAKGNEQARLKAEMAALEATKPAPLPTIPTIRNDFENVTPMHILRRGIWERKGAPVGMKPLDVFVGAARSELPLTHPTPRTELAHWLTKEHTALTARVIVNRIWQHYFGEGLVETANDFGRNGMKPSHPYLLDFLAGELLRHGWRLKPIHRMILLSRTYRQSARIAPGDRATRVDPNNRLFWRHSPRRLTGEELRDSMLRTAGVLNERLGGASVMLPVEQDLINLLYKPEQWQVTATATEHFRRSVYLVAKRNLRLPFMEAFDQPALLTSCFRREASTHAPQALELLNGTISNQLARHFADRLRAETEGDPSRIADLAFTIALGRAPSDAERRSVEGFLEDNSVKEFALALFNLNEFLYVF